MLDTYMINEKFYRITNGLDAANYFFILVNYNCKIPEATIYKGVVMNKYGYS